MYAINRNTTPKDVSNHRKLGRILSAIKSNEGAILLHGPDHNMHYDDLLVKPQMTRDCFHAVKRAIPQPLSGGAFDQGAEVIAHADSMTVRVPGRTFLGFTIKPESTRELKLGEFLSTGDQSTTATVLVYIVRPDQLDAAGRQHLLYCCTVLPIGLRDELRGALGEDPSLAFGFFQQLCAPHADHLTANEASSRNGTMFVINLDRFSIGQFQRLSAVNESLCLPSGVSLI